MNRGVIFNPMTPNLGDDIQTYAAARFIDSPEYLDRENLHEVDHPVGTIMNGWFMDHTEHWPPSQFVDPLFVSFHGNSAIINLDHFEYYKKFEPIGCRDYSTLRLFEGIGIKAYFSGCLTLTLPEMKEEKTDEIIVVDLLRNNFDQEYRELIKQKIIPEKWQGRLTYINHIGPTQDIMDPSLRMKNVETLLQRYAGARLVITSLIHCALPCIAIGTPVLFIDFGFSNRGPRRDRFEGVLEMFPTYSGIRAPFPSHSPIDKAGRMLKLYKFGKHRITTIPESFFEEPPEIPKLHVEVAEQLRNIVTNFVS